MHTTLHVLVLVTGLEKHCRAQRVCSASGSADQTGLGFEGFDLWVSNFGF